MRFFHSFKAVLAIAILAASVMLVTVDFAEARRGGSFGSRGARTFDRPAATQTAPRNASPIDRSMTPRQQAQPGAQQAGRGQPAAQQNRGGMFGGLAGGLLGGLMLGGLIGMMMGNGLGGLAGILGLLVQVGLAVLVVSLILRWMRSRRQPAYAGPAGTTPSADARPDVSRTAYTGSGTAGSAASGATAAPSAAPAAFEGGSDEVGLTGDDFDAFEQLLVEVQAAFSREDYGALRMRCTPEIVSYLSEELSQNAVAGRKNDVTDVKLLEGDLSEAWREDDREYATVAMRYEGVDVMRDRQTGEVVEGDQRPTETTEVWTFVRPVGGRWQVSAIQES